MAYSTSKKTIEAMEPHIQELLLGRPQAWLVTPPMTGHAWAYKIREVLKAVVANAEAYPVLARVAKTYTVQVDGLKVEARQMSNTPPTAIVGSHGTVNHGYEKAGPAINTVGPQSPFTIIEAWRRAQPSNDRMHFPSASLEDAQLKILYTWAQNWTPPLMILVDGAAVTVAPSDPEVVQYAWSPKDG